jgi:hypothetical protein
MVILYDEKVEHHRLPLDEDISSDCDGQMRPLCD